MATHPLDQAIEDRDMWRETALNWWRYGQEMQRINGIWQAEVQRLKDDAAWRSDCTNQVAIARYETSEALRKVEATLTEWQETASWWEDQAAWDKAASDWWEAEAAWYKADAEWWETLAMGYHAWD